MGSRRGASGVQAGSKLHESKNIELEKCTNRIESIGFNNSLNELISIGSDRMHTEFVFYKRLPRKAFAEGP